MEFNDDDDDDELTMVAWYICLQLLTVSECLSNPCRNGATCVDQYNGYLCQCSAGWQGPLCDQDVNECSTLAGTDLGCQNGATCFNTPGSFRSAHLLYIYLQQGPPCWPAKPKPSSIAEKHGHKLLNGGTKHRIDIH